MFTRRCLRTPSAGAWEAGQAPTRGGTGCGRRRRAAADQALGLELGDPPLDVGEGLSRVDFVVAAQLVGGQGRIAMVGETLPDVRSDRIEAEVQPGGEVHQDEVSLDADELDAGRDLDVSRAH